MGANYLREAGNSSDWETAEDALQPMFQAFKESIMNEIVVKPPIQKKVEQKLEWLFGRNAFNDF